jgi:hypothetical protein
VLEFLSFIHSNTVQSIPVTSDPNWTDYGPWTQFHCFINHACGAQNNVGHNLTVSEATADPNNLAPEIWDTYLGSQAIYNPAKERQIHFYSSATPLRDIKKGEELFDNYLPMGGRTSLYWDEVVTGLKAQCEGSAVGVVKEYDVFKKNATEKSSS